MMSAVRMTGLTTFLVMAGFGVWSGPAARAGDAIEIPFRFEHNEILVQVGIGRQEPVTMLLDTDTDPSSIHLSFAQAAGLKLRELHQEVTGGGTERPAVYLTKLQGVRLGSMPGRDLQVVAIDLSRIGKRLGIPVQGVLGHNFLAGRILQIDYRQRVLRFYRSSSELPGPMQGQTILPFRLGDDGDVLLDGVAINGQPVKATLDTGSDGTFSLTPAAVETLRLTETASHGQPDSSEGYKGTVQNTRGRVDRITVGPIEIASPEVVFWAKGAGRDRRPWDVDIGNSFLKDYIVTLDYPGKRIILQKP